MTGIGYLGAFLGGVLTLLSPCSALLLPAFFAYAFASRAQLLRRTAVFYIGLAGVLVPLGMGSSAASTLVYGHQAVLTTAAGVTLIGFGILQLAGGGSTIPGWPGCAPGCGANRSSPCWRSARCPAWPGSAPGRSWARCSPSRPPPGSPHGARRCWRSRPPG